MGGAADGTPAGARGRLHPARGHAAPDAPGGERTETALRVIDLLREYTPGYVTRYPEQAVPQVQSVLAKLTLCRTAGLGEHVFRCPECDFRLHVPNSCVDRHCPLCSGARRAEWLTKRAELLLPKITYFQVVFTLPELLWGLMLGNRRETYGLLFRAAWAARNCLDSRTKQPRL